MKILHTSDCHLGRSLYGRKCYEEFPAFLDWLARIMEDGKVDALLVAGDVFDTSAQPVIEQRNFITDFSDVLRHPAAVMLWLLPRTTIRRHS